MKKAIISLLILVFIFASCKKEDDLDNTDKVLPVINSINLTANDTLRNLFTIKVEATDNKSIDKVEYYVNDSLITQISSAPYDYQLNTLKLKDGSGTMKVVVYDAEGNKTESTRKYIVHNLLLTLKVGELNPVPYYVVVSDEKGNILNTATFKSNQTIKIMPVAPCEVKSFNVVYYNTWYQSTYMEACIHVKRGTELKLGITNEPKVIKNIKLHFKNDLPNFLRIDIGTDLSRYSFSSMADTSLLPATFPYTGDHKLLLQLQTTTGRYYKLYSINGVENLTVDFSSITTPQTMKSYPFPVTGSVFYIITAKALAAEATYEYYLSSGNKEYNANHVDLFYPAEYFRYKTLISYTLHDGSTKTYSNLTSGEVPETFSYITADAQMISEDLGGFKTTFSGTFDYYLAKYSIPSLNNFIFLQVRAPANQTEWILPDLSEAFGNTNFNLNNFLLHQFYMQDLQSVNLANNYYDPDIDQIIAAESYIKSLTYQVR